MPSLIRLSSADQRNLMRRFMAKGRRNKNAYEDDEKHQPRASIQATGQPLQIRTSTPRSNTVSLSLPSHLATHFLNWSPLERSVHKNSEEAGKSWTPSWNVSMTDSSPPSNSPDHCIALPIPAIPPAPRPAGSLTLVDLTDHIADPQSIPEDLRDLDTSMIPACRRS